MDSTSQENIEHLHPHISATTSAHASLSTESLMLWKYSDGQHGVKGFRAGRGQVSNVVLHNESSRFVYTNAGQINSQ